MSAVTKQGHQIAALSFCRRQTVTAAAHRCYAFAPSAVVGVLKGYDQLLNLVLDEAVEYLRGAGPPQHLPL